MIPAFLPCLEQELDIDATQLQSLLNQEFLSGKDLLVWPHPHGHARLTRPFLTSQSFLLSRSGPPGDVFSLDECRSIVALMDVSFAATTPPPPPALRACLLHQLPQESNWDSRESFFTVTVFSSSLVLRARQRAWASGDSTLTH